MSTVWNAERRAAALAPRRAELLRRLGGRIPGARAIGEDERELVVDDAIAYTVLEYPREIASADEAERVFWAACEFRVKHAQAGRLSTVRNGWRRAGEEQLDALEAAADPAGDVERVEERRLAEEFAQTLGAVEAAVLRCKYFSGTPEPLGYRTIAAQLGITPAAARGAERAIARNLERFSALYAAGRLCAERAVELTALAAGSADETQARVAHAHIAHCSHCRPLYAQQLRTLRSAAFQRKVAALLPAPPVVAAGDRPGRLRELFADWVARLGGHDATAAATQLGASGAGRGAGTIAALKLAALGLTGTAATVGACIATGVLPVATHAGAAAAKPPAHHARAKPVTRRVTPTATPAAAATPRPKRRAATRHRATAAHRTTQGATTPTSHEQPPASPAPANAAAGGESEFNPTYQPSAPAPPAPVPAAPGAAEFP